MCNKLLHRGQMQYAYQQQLDELPEEERKVRAWSSKGAALGSEAHRLSLDWEGSRRGSGTCLAPTRA